MFMLFSLSEPVTLQVAVKHMNQKKESGMEMVNSPVKGGGVCRQGQKFTHKTPLNLTQSPTQPRTAFPQGRGGWCVVVVLAFSRMVVWWKHPKVALQAKKVSTHSVAHFQVAHH